MQRRPIRNKPDLAGRHSAVTQKQPFGVAPNDDDGIQGAKHQLVSGTYRLGW
jgi:hypothetical protein